MTQRTGNSVQAPWTQGLAQVDLFGHGGIQSPSRRLGVGPVRVTEAVEKTARIVAAGHSEADAGFHHGWLASYDSSHSAHSSSHPSGKRIGKTKKSREP